MVMVGHNRHEPQEFAGFLLRILWLIDRVAGVDAPPRVGEPLPTSCPRGAAPIIVPQWNATSYRRGMSGAT